MKIEIYNGYWTREYVKSNPTKTFIFGDNTFDRTVTHHIPTSTQAVIRGLPNAIGIDTKKNRWGGYWSDSDYDEFVSIVDEAFERISQCNHIVLPSDGIGTGKAQLKEKAPKCWEYLQNKLRALSND